MSMISGQIDRLRTAAQTYRRLGNHSAESMLLDAADTIWRLRDDLQRANAENVKLRELLKGWQVYAVDNTFGDICKSEDVVDGCVVTFCDKHGYRLYTSMEVYGLLHDPNANERILTHDELPETIPCSDVFADVDV